MSSTYWVIAAKPPSVTIDQTLITAADILQKLIPQDGEYARIFRAAFFEVAPNRKLRDALEHSWSWSSDWYLWITSDLTSGGIDVEHEEIDQEFLEFLDRDIMSRNVLEKERHEVIQRARSGLYYSLRLSAFQPSLMYLSLLAVCAALATDCDGYVYTIERLWGSTIMPLSGSGLRKLLIDKEFRRKTGLQIDVGSAEDELTG